MLNDETRNPNAPEAQQSAENGHNRGAGGREDEALPAGAKQSTTLSVSGTEECALMSSTMRPDAREPPFKKGQITKRQRRLNEIFAPTTDKCEPKRHQANEPRDSKPVLPLKKQTKQEETTYSSWVCNSLGPAKWGSSVPGGNKKMC